MIKVKQVVEALELRAPFGYQESYDNSGLHTGSLEQEVTGILVCLDVLPEVLDEATKGGYNLIISHHPPFFSGLKNFTGSSLAVRGYYIRPSEMIWCSYRRIPIWIQWLTG